MRNLRTLGAGIAAGFATAAFAASLPPVLPSSPHALNPAGPLTIPWGSTPGLFATASSPCSPSVASFRHNGIAFDAQVDNCLPGGVPADRYKTDLLTINQPHAFDAGANPVQVNALPNFLLSFRGDGLTSGISTSDIFSTCDQRVSGQFDRESGETPIPPPNLRTPYETTRYLAGGCRFSPFGPGPLPGQHWLWATVSLPRFIPGNGQVWVYDRFNGALAWRPVANCGLTEVDSALTRCAGAPGARVTGSSATFELFGDFAATVNGYATVAFPQPVSKTLDLQDLWWVPSESGWGLNIAKNGENMFVTLFIYDQDGKPQWVVVPQGQWDPVHNVFWGDAFIPTGSSYKGYDTSKFNMGAAVGTVSLSFGDKDNGHLDYTLNGVSGGKTISRYVYAFKDNNVRNAGMWWGGIDQAGWGLSIQQQGDVLFATWFTYENGNVVWFVMPGSTRSGESRYTGALYRGTGGVWPGQRIYDASKTSLRQVGTMQLDFDSPISGTMKATVDGVTITQALQTFPF